MGIKNYNISKPSGIDTRMVKDGETIGDFCNRVYAHAIIYVFATSALLEQEVYKTNDILLKDVLSEKYEPKMKDAIHYFDCFLERCDKLVTLSEDVLQDFRYSIQVDMKGKVDLLKIAIATQCSKNGANNPYLLSHVILITILTDVVRKVWRISIGPTGEYADQLGRHISKALFFLDWLDRKILDLQDMVETTFAGKSLSAGEDVENALMDIVNGIFMGGFVEDAIRYGYTENGIGVKI